MIRMLIIGYCFGIRSERRLCEEAHLNLAYRWFCRLGIEDGVPEHSTFSKNRHGRFRESDTFRHVFETVLKRCMSEGLVGGEGFAIDASVVKADAAFCPKQLSPVPRWTNGLLVLRRRKSGGARSIWKASKRSGRPQTQRKNISITDPAAEWTCASGGPAFFAYSTNYLVDVRYGVIVDVEATSAHRTKEVDATRTMIDQVERRFKIKPKRLIGDMAYGSAGATGLDGSTTKPSNRMCHCGTGLNVVTARYRAASFIGARKTTSIVALRESHFAASGAPSNRSDLISRWLKLLSTARENRTATTVH